MAYLGFKRNHLGEMIVEPNDSTQDAYERVRVSSPITVFNSKEDLSAKDFLWNTSTATGGTITRTAARASYALAVTSSSGSSAIRKSRMYVPCQSGAGVTVIATFVMGTGQTNTVKTVGLNDSNNGAFLQQNGTTLNIVLRSSVTGSPVDTVVAQSSWNMDKLDGTGKSGITLDVTKAQTLIIDFRAFGVGRIRFGFIIGGSIYYCHEIVSSNSFTSVYCSTLNLPVTFEIFNSAGAAGTASLEMIAATVSIEGCQNYDSTPYSALNLVAKNISTTLLPLVILRPKSGFPRPPFRLTGAAVAGETGGKILHWGIFLNPTLTGGTGPTYNSVHADSYMEFDVAATGTVSAGKRLFGGVTIDLVNTQFDNFAQTLNLASSDFAGTTVDTIVLAAARESGGAIGFTGSISWEEYV